MAKQIKNLSKLLLCNFWGLNEFRFSKDKGKRARFVLAAVAIGMLVVFYIAYVALYTYAYIQMGLSDVLPAYMLTLISLLSLFFSIYKAGNVIFQMKSYETLISFPVSPTAIIVSRFLTMYVGNITLSFITFLPVTIIYGYSIRPGIWFYFMMLPAVFLVPLLPMTVATAVGVLIIAVSSRTKHKTLVNILLTLGLVVGIIVLPMFMSGMSEAQVEEMMLNMSAALSEQMNHIYPPARLFTEAVVEGKIGSFLLFAAISAGAFAILVWLVQRRFVAICSAMKAKEAKGSYTIRKMEQHSLLKAMLFREMKHYFSSSVYVINTMIGFIMMAVGGVAILIMGVDTLESTLGLPGLFQKVGPFILAVMGAMTSTTAVSVSMEGKQFWLLQTMPLSVKTIINSKILLNMIVALPFYLISVICILVSLRFDMRAGVWFILIPLVYLIFASVVGVTVNLKMPMMNWENETVAVKQSPAVIVSMLIGLVACGIPGVIHIFAGNVNGTAVNLLAVIGVGLSAALMYVWDCRRKLYD